MTIVGVTPPDFFGVDVGRSVDVIAPYHLAPRLTSSPFDDDTVWLNIMVRARRGVDGAAMTAALRAAQPQIRAAAMPKKFPNPVFLHNPFTLEPAATGISTLRERFERPLAALFVVVALVLLIACANVGNLLLARGSARRHELSVRVAIGASRWQLARQVLVESLPASERGTLVDRLAKRVAAVPGVQAAGGALNPPIVGEIGGADLVISTPGSLPAPDAPRNSHVDLITPRWFAAYGIPIEAGRDFDDRDVRDGPPVMIVNDAFVRRLFPGRNVTGMVLSLAWRIERGDVPYGTRTIVGVAADSVYHTIREPVQSMIFVPLVSRDPLLQKDFYLGVRASAGSPALLERPVASTIIAVSPDVAFSFEPLAQALDESLADNRVIAVVSTSFGVRALVLAAVGLYGVTAYGVAQRRTEIGIRMALGAKPGTIVTTIVAHVSKLVGIGVAAGAGISLWAATLVRSLLYGLEPRDPTTLIGAVVVLATAAIVAGWLPAWRASRIDPAEVLRES